MHQCVRAFTQPDGFVNEQQLARYKAYGNSNAGIIVVEGSNVCEACQKLNCNIGIWSDDHIAGLQKLAAVCKSRGSVAVIQLNMRSITSWKGKQSLSELNEEDAVGIITLFVNASIRAQKTGFDGVELHAAHGFLLSQIYLNREQIP